MMVVMTVMVSKMDWTACEGNTWSICWRIITWSNHCWDCWGVTRILGNHHVTESTVMMTMIEMMMAVMMIVMAMMMMMVSKKMMHFIQLYLIEIMCKCLLTGLDFIKLFQISKLIYKTVFHNNAFLILSNNKHNVM